VRRLVRKMDFNVIDIAPAPAFRRVVALDDRMTAGFKVSTGVTMR
jgi:hypothetical protein